MSPMTSKAHVAYGAGWRTGSVNAGWLTLDRLAGYAAIAALVLATLQVWILPAVPPTETADRDAAKPGRVEDVARPGPETLIAGYVGAPFYYRSDVHLVRPGDNTDATFRRLGWDGDALHFPIDGGVRAVKWGGTFGFMVDFLHNKAVPRLGKGAHGRPLSNPVIESVEAEGTLGGKPVPSPVKLTDVFERLEFTHGHNMLFATPLVRMAAVMPGIRPYFGVGAGVAVPHVEVWFPGQDRKQRTNEYQFTGPAWQFVAGIEIRSGKLSYFLEYKFSQAWIGAALTGDQSWKNFNMPGDLLRQFRRWLSGEPPSQGRISTSLAAHQGILGAGYWLQRPSPAAP